MSDVRTPIQGEQVIDRDRLPSAAPAQDGRTQPPKGPIRFRLRRRRRHGGGHGPDAKPRLRKLRFVLILTGLATLALVSTVFGMLMAVASDIPQLENRQQYKLAANSNSFLYDDHWRPIGILAPPNHLVVDGWNDISPWMIGATVAVEDKRFWSDPGVDLRGIGRAIVADITGGARQGASTIAQQFVKNALAEQNNRTIFEKLRETALAYHLTRRWKKTKILTEYLNTIYFGNGAYGVESAARVYFGKVHGFDGQSPTGGSSTGQGTGCGDSDPTLKLYRPKCAAVLKPWEAALLAGMVASPAAFDPVAHPAEARARRNLVLKDMLQQRYLTPGQYEQATGEPLPTADDIQQPSEPSAAPYFTSWIRPQILAILRRGTQPSVAEYRAYYGGLKIRTTLDLEMQHAADQAISSNLGGPGMPTASLVAIDNKTGEVRAMVGGPIVGGQEDFTHFPFNLATEGERQPGSAFKPFTLAAALESGFTPSSVFLSAPADFIVPGTGGREHFVVKNFGNTYSGPITLAQATAISDNSVFSRLGIEGLGPNGTKRVVAIAKAMGIRTPVSHNYAMILGGLRVGVSPLDMAHAFETFATGGEKVFNPVLGARDQGPTGIAQISCPGHVCPFTTITDRPTYDRVLPASVAQTVHDLLSGVVQTGGTGALAAISGVDVVGKTGTTTNYGDAWFVGWTPQLTTAIWVGFPTKLASMYSDYNGGPVEGGTYPAIIWHDFMVQALQILKSEEPQSAQTSTSTTSTGTAATGFYGTGGTIGTTSTGTSAPSVPTAPSTATGTVTAAPAPSTGSAAPTGTVGGGGATGGGFSGGGGGGSGSGSAGGGGGGGGSGSGSAGGGGTGSGSSSGSVRGGGTGSGSSSGSVRGGGTGSGSSSGSARGGRSGSGGTGFGGSG